MGPELFTDLVGENLSGVTFVRDYLQLEFNPPPLLTIFTPTTIRCGDAIASFGEPSFANLIIGQIDKVVATVNLVPEKFLEIRFEDESTLTVSLRPEDHVGPEAINLFCKDRSMVVI